MFLEDAAGGLQDAGCSPWSQPHRCEAAVALCPQVQPVARLSVYCQQRTHAANTAGHTDQCREKAVPLRAPAPPDTTFMQT